MSLGVLFIRRRRQDTRVRCQTTTLQINMQWDLRLGFRIYGKQRFVGGGGSVQGYLCKCVRTCMPVCECLYTCVHFIHMICSMNETYLFIFFLVIIIMM